MEEPMKSGKIITFCNMKGGVGKTTICYLVGRSIALNAAEHNKKTKILFVDCDAQANLTYMAMNDFVNKPKPAFGNILTELMQRNEALTAEEHAEITIKNTNHVEMEIRKKSISYDVITTNSSFEVTRSVLEANSVAFYTQFPDWMDYLKTQYDYIFFDTPPRMDIATTAPLLKSDYYIVVTTPDPKAYKGAIELIDQIGRMAKQIVSTSVFLGTIVNMYAKTNMSQEMLDLMTQEFGKEHLIEPILPAREAFRTVIYTNEKFVDAMISDLVKDIFRRIKKIGG